MLLKNAKNWPEVYSCRFLEGGIVSYEDSDAGIALLKKETIDRMAHTFIGRPVIIDHQNVTPANFEKVAVGYVINVHFNPADAWFYADFIITDDKARVLIDEKGYSVSCAYNVLEVSEGGLWHDIKFDGEITDGSFTHLALVESPRYEDSKITKQLPAMLVNGKAAHFVNNREDTTMNIFKFIKKENDKPEDFSKMFVEFESKAVPLNEVLMACINGKKLDLSTFAAKNDKQQYMAQDHDIVDLNGKTVSIGELKACYQMKTENAKSDEDKEKEKELEAKKKNDKEEEEKKAKEEKDKENAKAEEEKKAEEAKNAKEAEEKTKKEEEEKTNAKKKAAEELEAKNAKERQEEFFKELGNANKTFDADDTGAARPPMTRAERAKAFRERTNKKV